MIENQEFMAMRTAQKIWPAPTTTENQLRELVSDGLIQGKDLVVVLFCNHTRNSHCKPTRTLAS